MAYFANGCEGEVFDEECAGCIFGDKPCPIAWITAEHNYSACNNPEARAIMDKLVKQNGECCMRRAFPEVFAADKEKN